MSSLPTSDRSPRDLPARLVPAWSALSERVQELRDLDGVTAILDWDQETMMPPRGAATRGRQSALMAAHRHRRLTDPAVGDWLAALDEAREDLDPVQRATVHHVGRAYRRGVRVPERLVRELAQARTLGFEAWMRSREAGGPGFAAFAPALGRLVDLTRESARCIDEGKLAYDVLLDEFEPGARVADLAPLFARLRGELQALLDAIAGAAPLPASPFGGRTFDLAAQKAFSERVLRDMGFDFERGRLDHAEHPFSTGTSPEDVRLTTHLYEGDLLAGLSSTIHEGGHGLFEQGFDPSLWGTAAAESPSFGLHESQSRFWENQVGRSLPFFRHYLPALRAAFPGGMDGAGAEDLYREANRVERSLIRVDADEATYNLHIIVRFEIELALFAGDLPVDDLPEAWNSRYRDLLGVTPPDDKRGVLQDVHWSHGAFGYFPSYTLGNLYAASFTRKMEEDLGDLDDLVGRGELRAVLAWLRGQVHRHGRLLDTGERVKAIVGERDPVADLVDHLWTRHGGLYGVARRA